MKQLLKNIIFFIVGIFLSMIPPVAAFFLAVSIGAQASFLFYALLLLFYLPVIFIWQKSKAMVLGIISFSILAATFLGFISYKANYESETENVKAYPSLVRLTSIPPGAEFRNVATNKVLMLHEPARSLYDKEIGKIVATHSSFPSVELYAEIKNDTVEFFFDFKKNRVENRTVPFLLRFIE